MQEVEVVVLKIAALLLQLGVVLFGFTSQVSRNYQRNECGEVKIKLYLLFASFVCRFAGSLADRVWYVFVPDILGILILGVTVSQIKQPRNWAARAIHQAYEAAASPFVRNKKRDP
jgi:hypothetical protein